MAAASARKARSHQRILRFASRMFRESGTHETGVDDVMNAAGLTRGGFYAHFRDKGALVAEALETAFGEAHEMLFGAELPPRGHAWLERATRRYVSRSHVARPGSGCAIPALGVEVARDGEQGAKVFTRNIRVFLREIEARLSTPARPGRHRAIVTLTLWVGAVTLARASADEHLAAEILEACRREILGSKRGAARAAAHE